MKVNSSSSQPTTPQSDNVQGSSGRIPASLPWKKRPYIPHTSSPAKQDPQSNNVQGSSGDLAAHLPWKKRPYSLFTNFSPDNLQVTSENLQSGEPDAKRAASVSLNAALIADGPTSRETAATQETNHSVTTNHAHAALVVRGTTDAVGLDHAPAPRGDDEEELILTPEKTIALLQKSDPLPALRVKFEGKVESPILIQLLNASLLERVNHLSFVNTRLTPAIIDFLKDRFLTPNLKSIELNHRPSDPTKSPERYRHFEALTITHIISLIQCRPEITSISSDKQFPKEALDFLLTSNIEKLRLGPITRRNHIGKQAIPIPGNPSTKKHLDFNCAAKHVSLSNIGMFNSLEYLRIPDYLICTLDDTAAFSKLPNLHELNVYTPEYTKKSELRPNPKAEKGLPWQNLKEHSAIRFLSVQKLNLLGFQLQEYTHPIKTNLQTLKFNGKKPSAPEIAFATEYLGLFTDDDFTFTRAAPVETINERNRTPNAIKLSKFGAL